MKNILWLPESLKSQRDDVKDDAASSNLLRRREPCSFYTVDMRRWLLLLMLVVLPMQFASAAAATYCRHEPGVSKHFGHHEHRHQASGDQKSALESAGDESHTGTALGDPDCEYCHLGAAHPLLQDFGQPRSAVDSVMAVQEVLSFGTRDPDVLDRPNWTSLA